MAVWGKGEAQSGAAITKWARAQPPATLHPPSELPVHMEVFKQILGTNHQMVSYRLSPISPCRMKLPAKECWRLWGRHEGIWVVQMDVSQGEGVCLLGEVFPSLGSMNS